MKQHWIRRPVLLLLGVAFAGRSLMGNPTNAEESSFVKQDLLLSWTAKAATGQAPTSKLEDDGPDGDGPLLVGLARFAPGPGRIELAGRGALAGTRPLRPKRITVEAVFRADRKSGPLQLIVTTMAPKVRAQTGITGNARQWVLEIRGDPPQGYREMGTLEFGIFGQDLRWHLAKTNRRLSTGWHHAVGTFDGKTARLFLDGQMQKIRPGIGQTFTGNIHVPPDGVINVPAVGSNSLNYRNAFEGAVALVRFYSRALSEKEIAQNHRFARSLVPELPARLSDSPARAKPPFKVLFSNDFTNLHVTSPYHKKGEPFRPGQLRGSVDEAAGADVHLLQPTTGWVPWWPSRIYPMSEHHQWWARHYGLDPSRLGVMGVHRYILDGGDPFKDFISECRETGQQPFISYRLNDIHHLRYADTPGNRQGMHAISRFYVEHPEYRLSGPGSGHDWAIPEAREHKFAFIKEICENYDLAGLELDFMRFPFFFKVETPVRLRVKIMTDFVAKVRALLDRTSGPGQHRWLCARVPAKLDRHPEVGIDLLEMVDAGLDMINLSSSYFTAQENDVAKVRQMLPETALYLEMCHCTMTGKAVGRGGDNTLFLRTTDPQYTTTAHLAYQHGADGVSLFNFVYTREHGTPGRGPFNEPPFHLLKHLGDPAWLARQPQWYFLANTPFTHLDGHFEPGDARTYELELAPNSNQVKDGILRIMIAEEKGPRQWMIKLNGATLETIPFVRKPLPHPYEAGIASPSQYTCFRFPRELVHPGPNKIAIFLERGVPATLQYLDLVLP